MGEAHQMLDFAPLIALPLLIIKVIDFLRYLKARDWNGVSTQLITWIAGVVVLMLVAHTSWASAIPIGNAPLTKIGLWSQIFAGLSISSTSSVIKDALKSFDNHNTSAIPTLLPAGPQNVTPNKGGVAATDVG